MSIEKLDEAGVLAEIPSVAGWKVIYGGKLLRLFHFRSFAEALGFMVTVGVEADKMNHHPEMRNVYTMVEFILTTHDAGGLTALDFELARKIQSLAGNAIEKKED
jgi:4a-hydroxytetrahydrobiopterin dehydratase